RPISSANSKVAAREMALILRAASSTRRLHITCVLTDSSMALRLQSYPFVTLDVTCFTLRRLHTREDRFASTFDHFSNLRRREKLRTRRMRLVFPRGNTVSFTRIHLQRSLSLRVQRRRVYLVVPIKPRHQNELRHASPTKPIDIGYLTDELRIANV